MNTTRKTISGQFRGIEKGYKGELVKVGINKYRLNDITQDSHYLFVAEIATMRARQELKKFKVEYNKNKKEFFRRNYNNIRSFLYTKSGYTNDSGTWTPKSEYIKQQAVASEKNFNKEQETNKKKIYEQHKLFGLIDVTLPTEQADKKREKQTANKES